MLKRWLSITLAALMLIGVLASCATTSDDPEKDSQNTTPSGTTEEEDTREPLEIPDTRYDGTELCFLTRDESEWSTLEIYSEGLTSGAEGAADDNISQAVYERNKRIENDYGVTILENKVNTTEHGTKITNEIAAPTGDFQVIITNTSGSASNATQNKIWNLNDDRIENLDLSKSWWDQLMVEGLSIEGRLFFATGDLLTADNDATFVLLFNKTILKNNQLDDPYALVENNEWTMQKFYDMSTVAAMDQDGDPSGLSYDADISGYAYTGDGPYCFLFAGGITLCEKNEDDYPEYNLNVDRAQSISEMGKRIFDSQHATNLNAVTDSEGIAIMEVGKKCFGENHALFLGEVMQAVTRMRGYDVDFGILPYPMYDTNQKDYYSMMHLTASMVSIPKSVDGDELVMVASMLEAMAYHSVDTLTVQYYDINLKTKDSKDAKSGPMMDKILANRACDLTYYFQWGSNAFGQVAGTLLPTSGGAISSLDKQFSRSIDREIERALKSMNKAN